MKERDINIEENLQEEEMSEEMEDAQNEKTSEESDDKTAETAEEQADTEEADDSQTPLNEKIEELRDKYLRSVAEFDNYRKRTLKERAELILNGGEKVITAILPVIDDMERAMENGAKTDDPAVLREGMELIHQKFLKILEAQGVSIIETDDADFDTDIHDAVAMVPGMGYDKK